MWGLTGFNSYLYCFTQLNGLSFKSNLLLFLVKAVPGSLFMCILKSPMYVMYIWIKWVFRLSETLHAVLPVSRSPRCAASLPVGKSLVGVVVVASLFVVSCWWFGVFQDVVVGVTSQASYQQLSKSTVLLRRQRSHGVEKRMSMWGQDFMFSMGNTLSHLDISGT